MASLRGSLSFLQLLSVFALHQSILLFVFTTASNVHIVYMGETPYFEPQLVQDSHHEILSTLLGSKEAARASILYSYKHGFSGFAAFLTPTQAQLIADLPGVVSVVPNRILSLHTTRSWDFLQLNPQPVDGILSKGQYGDSSIIGILDTGIWPESESFKDDGMGEIPSRWNGICQEGEEFNRSNCNRKIIGARWYIKGFEAELGKVDTGGMIEFLSPRDAMGHGTHTSSTAAGAMVANASFMGLAQGLARGGASAARIAMYKVCWSTGGCSSVDILAAFDDAISDGVDVLSVSLGSPPPLASYFDDTVAIGSFHAVAKGIPVVCAAGNSGPYAQTVVNTAPWIITVAASTIDRAFPTSITLGNNQTVVGQALYTRKHMDKFYPLVYGNDIASNGEDKYKAKSCGVNSLNATLAKGKVVLCFQTPLQRSITVAMDTVKRVRGIGLIFAQFPTKIIAISTHIPSVQVDFSIATLLLTYMGNARNPIVRFSHTRTVVGRLISPEVASFSSRGPSSLSPSVLKPDIAAPGVNILASWSPASSSSSSDMHPLNFNIDSGTSMACPHITGIVALLKSIHPNWSPAGIKSALVTTASVRDKYGQNVIAEGFPHKIADPFDYGGGHVNPNKASDPGLIYDIQMKDYIKFLCSMGYNNSVISLIARKNIICHKSFKSQVDLNLPSITIPELAERLVVSRTVTNVGPINSTYTARVKAPPGVIVKVKPLILSFNSTVKQLKFKVIFSSLLIVQGRYSFGSLSWEDGVHKVRIPLIVRTVIENFYSDT